MSRWPHQSEVDKFYGNPRGTNGQADPTWESENIVYVSPPWKLVTSWDFKPVKKGVPVHQLCADSLNNVFLRIWESADENVGVINEWGMHLYSGGYNFRLMHGSTSLSMHSWGCAVDFDSERNAFGDPNPNFALIPQVLDAFASEEWIWGGKWSKPDGMHWQAADI